MNKKNIWKAGLLFLIIGMVSISGYYCVIKRNSEMVAENMENETEEPDSDKTVESGTDKPDSDENVAAETKPAEETKPNFKYDVLSEDTVVITKYLGDETLVFVPERLDGKVVSAIGESAFQGNDSVEQIVLPQGIEVIESQAFKDCSGLQYVVMGTELESIGQDAFSYCSSLKELRLPEGMTVIDLCICAYCPSLEKVVIPQSMEEISPSAFMECDKLYLIYGSNSCAENYAQINGLVYIDLERIEEEGGIVWLEKHTGNETNDSAVEEGRMPAPIQYDSEIMDYDPEDTIYYKTYYDDFQEGKIMNIKYSPHMEIREELEDYFFDASEIFYLDYLVGMFYDNRTIETDEKELEQLFLNHGYIIYFHNAEFQDFHLRFIEIAEKEGLSLFPIRILMQTWDDDFIYLQDITGPIPRKIRDLMVVDKDGVWQLIVHSSGFSKELIPEEELMFWKFTGTYWILVPMELEIDTTHAFFEDYPFYPDLDRDELFEANFYRDGIAYRSDMQPYNRWGSECAYRLGKMEIVEENRSFRLYTVVTGEGQPYETSSYIQYTIK